MCRSMVLLLGGAMLAATAFAQSTSQNSGSTPQKLPPPPTIDVNVNQNETLSTVRYDNKYEIYGGLGFSHFQAGPQLAAGADLGGFGLSGTWGVNRPPG